MSNELAKVYDPSAVETEAYRVWTDARAFHAEPTDPGQPYSIVIPPPNVTAALHLGHALNNTLQDILTRMHRMIGDNTCWLPGTDHAGIATQTIVEKRVLQEEGKRRTDFQREEFVGKIQAWKDEYEARITEQLKRMGCSCDWDRQAFTMDEQRAKAVREAFFRLFKDGLIYRGKRLVNWDPATQTALADDEVEMEEIDGHFYYLRYPLADGSGHVTVATTRPETMLGDTAVAINPKDPRAAALRGRMVKLPIVNRIVPIIEDEYVVLPDANSDDAKAKFATGFLKVTPAHDPNDYAIGQRHKLAMINIFSPTAAISKDHGWPAEDFAAADAFLKEQLLGKDRFEARKLVVDFFKKAGLLEEIRPYRHSVGHSYRSHVPIEPWLSDQWYCSVTDDRLAGAALRAMAREQYEEPTESGARGGTGGSPVSGADCGEPNAPAHGRAVHATTEWQGRLRFYPARYARTFQTWHEGIRDWCISRQLWWGHRIPVWSKAFTIRDGYIADEYAAGLAHSLATSRDVAVLSTAVGRWEPTDWSQDSECPPDGEYVWYICLRTDQPSLDPHYEIKSAIDELSRADFIRDPDVLDTWFSSALWPLSTLEWPNDSALNDARSALNVWNPTDVLCTAREIITLWVSRMVMFNLYFLNRLPFYDVFIHAMIQDGHGQKMSKSLGNGVDPVDIIQRHGADAMRFTLASMATNTQDVRMPVDLVDPHSGETFTPKFVTDSAGYLVAAPIQDSPKNPRKKMVSSYGVSSGKAKPTGDMPLAKNTSSKFDLGRNFCNKLWNAARFALMNLGNVGPAPRTNNRSACADPTSAPEPLTPTLSPEYRGEGEQPEHREEGESVDETKWSMADRWIVSRFNRTVAEAIEAMKDYRFDQYARTCYDFFWRDLCDWYLEAIKPAMKDPARAGQTANVLSAVFDGSLRLMHPIIPFITETIWWKLNDVRPQRGLPGRLECAQSPLLIKAKFPTVGEFAEAAEFIFPRLQEIIAAIRTVRNDYKVDQKKPVDVSISGPAESARQILANRELIETLATCRIREAAPNLPAPANAARASAAGCEIFVEDLIDPQAEKQRITKRTDELTKQIAAMNGRLANESYIKKAPPHLVEQTRKQLADAEAELARLKEELAKLGG